MRFWKVCECEIPLKYFHFYHCAVPAMPPQSNGSRSIERGAKRRIVHVLSKVVRLSPLTNIINEVLFITREPLKPRSLLISNFSLHFDCETLDTRHWHRCASPSLPSSASSATGVASAIGMRRHNVLMFFYFHVVLFSCQFNEIGSCCSLPLTHHFLVCNMIDLIPVIFFFFVIRLHNRSRTTHF